MFSRYDDDGELCITIRAGAADGAILLAAVEAARTDLERRASRIFPRKDPTHPGRRRAATGYCGFAAPTWTVGPPRIRAGPGGTVHS